MAPDVPSQLWFEMADLRRRRFASMVWVPLYSSEKIAQQGEYGEPGWKEERLLLHSTAFAPDKRAKAEQLDLHEFSHERVPHAYRNGEYKPCEVYQYNDHEDFGVDFVFNQHLGNEHPRILHLSQDLVMALHLLQEDDHWVRPEEDYALWQSQKGFPANAEEPGVRVTHVLRDALAGEPTTIFRSNQRDYSQCHLYAPFVLSAGKYVRSISTLL
jgi:hypothetical protein